MKREARLSLSERPVPLVFLAVLSAVVVWCYNSVLDPFAANVKPLPTWFETLPGEKMDARRALEIDEYTRRRVSYPPSISSSRRLFDA